MDFEIKVVFREFIVPNTNQLNKYILQARHNFSKTEGAAQKLGGQNIKNYLIFGIFELKF